MPTTLFRQILQNAADAFEVIGVVQRHHLSASAADRLKNVPASMPMGWSIATPAPALAAAVLDRAGLAL